MIAKLTYDWFSTMTRSIYIQIWEVSGQSLVQSMSVCLSICLASLWCWWELQSHQGRMSRSSEHSIVMSSEEWIYCFFSPFGMTFYNWMSWHFITWSTGGINSKEGGIKQGEKVAYGSPTSTHVEGGMKHGRQHKASLHRSWQWHNLKATMQSANPRTPEHSTSTSWEACPGVYNVQSILFPIAFILFSLYFIVLSFFVLSFQWVLILWTRVQGQDVEQLASMK